MERGCNPQVKVQGIGHRAIAPQAARRIRRLVVEQLESRELLAGLPTGEFGDPPPRISPIYWEAAQLVSTGRTDELPKPTTPISNQSSPGYVHDFVRYDDQFRIHTDLHVLTITPELLMKISSLGDITATYSSPTGAVSEDALTWSHVEAWIDPNHLEQVLQLDDLMFVDFPGLMVSRGPMSWDSTSILGVQGTTEQVPGDDVRWTTAAIEHQKIDPRVIAALDGDTSVRMPKVISDKYGNDVLVFGADNPVSLDRVTYGAIGLQILRSSARTADFNTLASILALDVELDDLSWNDWEGSGTSISTESAETLFTLSNDDSKQFEDGLSEPARFDLVLGSDSEDGIEDADWLLAHLDARLGDVG